MEVGEGLGHTVEQTQSVRIPDRSTVTALAYALLAACSATDPSYVLEAIANRGLSARGQSHRSRDVMHAPHVCKNPNGSGDSIRIKQANYKI